MLEIDSIIIRNFLSYGDYDTVLSNLASRGPTTIVGEVVDFDGAVASNGSNGSGKSSITVAIVWCLFGRTFTKDRPGDNVINFYVGENCFVEIRTVDGWVIKRTRKVKGHDDLLVYRDGNDETRATNDAAQKFINSKFQLDFQIFTTSTFFGQMSKPILEISDQARKETLERLLGLDLINTWAQNAKDKVKSIESVQETKRIILQKLKNDVTTFRDLVRTNKEEREVYLNSRRVQIEQLENSIDDLKTEIDYWNFNVRPELEREEGTILKVDRLKSARIEVDSSLSAAELSRTKLNAEANSISISIERDNRELSEASASRIGDLHKRHTEADNKDRERRSIEGNIESIRLSKRIIDQDIKQLVKSIKEWKDKEGTICPSCEQEVVSGHVADCTADLYTNVKQKLAESKSIEAQIADLELQRDSIIIDRPSMSIAEDERLGRRIDNLTKSINTNSNTHSKLLQDIATINNTIVELQLKLSKIDSVLSSLNVTITMADIQSSRREQDDRISKMDRLVSELNQKKTESNPFDKVISTLQVNLKKSVVELSSTNEELKKLNLEAVHYQYLWRAYTDRNKVKKLLLGTMIPYLNQRIQYYLDCFRCPIKILFKDNLAVDSSVWHYEYCSGGERRRIDLSIMFALHDLYLGIHGRQCNIMVLDEVDGRLDGSGIESFIDIVNNNFTVTKDDGNSRSKPGTVFVISHRAEMVDAFPSKITIKKDANLFSHIV